MKGFLMETVVDLDLIQKYDKPGPRYTSYPTAPLFSESVGEAELLEALQRSWDSLTPLSLYVHVPFCNRLCWYCGCNMLVSRDQVKMADHAELVKQEIARLAPRVNPKREAWQVHFGGGTPNAPQPGVLAGMMTALRDHFTIPENAEISLEIDPRLLSNEHVAAIAEAGFNRVSMGIQDFNDKVQQAINRIQPYDMVADCVARLRGLGLHSVNMDLIYGLPHQNPETYAETLDQTIGLAPDRIALFNFAYVPWMKPHQKLIKQEDLPSPGEKLEILKLAVERLTGAGYVFIGMDHFAKPDDPLAQALAKGELHRNFQGYTTMPGLEMLAFGMSAISMLDDIYVQNQGELGAYEDAVKAGGLACWRGVQLTDDDRFRRQLINRLLCDGIIDLPWIEAACGQDFDAYFPGVRAQLEALAEDYLLAETPRGYRVTEMGRLLIRNIAMPFDKYLEQMKAEKRARFSRTV